jgi:hypothetical protein
MLLRGICAFVLFGILVAGLWPFHAPRNEVSWLTDRNGLFFGKYGSIVSAASFKAHPLPSCSLEILLEPKRVHSSGTILAFYWPENHIVPFSLHQSLGDLVLQRTSDDPLPHPSEVRVYVGGVFRHQKLVLVTLNSSQAGTTVYADGGLVKKFVDFRLSSQDLTGKLIVGDSPVIREDWSGQLAGLAVYDRELTQDEVAEHYENWTKGQQANLARSEGAVALYLFKEGGGSVVHDQVNPATDLLIPERFFLFDQQFLERPWDEFRNDWDYWINNGINIFGFMPLGFFFYAYFSSVRRTKRAIAGTIGFGFAISLTIEVLQALLPTRDSGMTDLITNTLGSALGAILCAWMAEHNWFARAGLLIRLPSREMKKSSSIR